MLKVRYKVIVSYFGRNYYGWQKQPNVPTIQGEIEAALGKLFNTQIVIHGAGRTDAGVHALRQCFHFDAENKFKPNDLKYRLNKILGPDIKIISVRTVDDSFHARFNAVSKTYVYKIYLGSKEPFTYYHALIYPKKLNVAKMRSNLQKLVGTHSFKNFTSKETDEKKFVRNISKASISVKNNLLQITITGEGFMRGQVRMIVGALIALSENQLTEEEFQEYLNSEERKIINYKASSEGLYLKDVRY